MIESHVSSQSLSEMKTSSCALNSSRDQMFRSRSGCPIDGNYYPNIDILRNDIEGLSTNVSSKIKHPKFSKSVLKR